MASQNPNNIYHNSNFFRYEIYSGVPMNSKRPFNVYRAIPPYQRDDDGDTASSYHFPNCILAVSTENSRFAKLDAASLLQHSGSNHNKLCRQGFLTNTDENSLRLPYLYYNYDITALRNRKVESILLLEAPQAFYLADGLDHIISRDPHIQMRKDSGNDFSSSTLSCKACLIRPSCSSTVFCNQGDLELRPDRILCKTNPEFLLAKIQVTPSLDQTFQQVPRSTNNFHTYSVMEARHSVLSTVRFELTELLNVKTMSSEPLSELTRPFRSVLFFHLSGDLCSLIFLSSHTYRNLFFSPLHHPLATYIQFRFHFLL